MTAGLQNCLTAYTGYLAYRARRHAAERDRLELGARAAAGLYGEAMRRADGRPAVPPRTQAPADPHPPGRAQLPDLPRRTSR